MPEFFFDRRDDIKSNIYSLNIDDYIKRQKVKSEYHLVEVASVCKEIKSGGTPLRNRVEYFRNGNNLWVTHFSLICIQNETTDRIKFLKGIAG